MKLMLIQANDNGNTPLIVAIREGREDIVKKAFKSR